MVTAQLTLTAPDQLADVVAWTRENPEAWAAVAFWAHADRAAGIAPSTRLYCCLLRRPHMASALGMRRCSAAVLVDDHLSSGMARLLNRTWPALECPTRKATADGWGAP